MMLVIDANILFATLIRESYTRQILLVGNHELYAPDYIFDEVKKHFQTLKQKTGLPKADLDELLSKIVKNGNIRIVKPENFKEKFTEARAISPDPDDVEYFALALKLDCPIWSNDKRLKEQKKVRIVSTKELARI